MSRYDMLVRVLDGIRKESEGTKYSNRYAFNSSDEIDIWQARSRAYIHLYLKVMFGLRSFEAREIYITDGGRDGGIDGYFLDAESKIVYVIQSKFRTSRANFENKPIEISELFGMQIRRVLAGEESDEQGFEYNGKIKGMQRALSQVYDIGRYNYKVIILANMAVNNDDAILRLTDNTPFEVINYEKSYVDLLYPVLSGTLFKARELGITLDLSNKSSGSKIGYTVTAEGIECEISVVYVPTIEIARILSEYKNSILSHNPRSYLEFEGEKVNSAIRSSIVAKAGNDFALLNNGITIICDESSVSDRSGRKGKAQLFLLNPQIINGGQTAYTLSRIYDELTSDKREEIFAEKEVLVKAIAVSVDSNDPVHLGRRATLIENISQATNSQTVVTNADRTSGDPLSVGLQEMLFSEFGVLYERKRGEYSDGVRDGYISSEEIVTRTRFCRIYLAANGSVARAQKKRVTIQDLGPDLLHDREKIMRSIIALDAFDILSNGRRFSSQRSYVTLLPQIRAAMVASSHFDCDLRSKGMAGAELVSNQWSAFLKYVAVKEPDKITKIVKSDGISFNLILKTARGTWDKTLDMVIDEFFSDRSNLMPNVQPSM